MALTPWNFFMPSNPPAPPLSGGGGGGISGDEQNAVAFGLAAALEDSSPAPSQAAPPLPPEVAAAIPSRDDATESLLAQWPWIEEDPAEEDDERGRRDRLRVGRRRPRSFAVIAKCESPRIRRGIISYANSAGTSLALVTSASVRLVGRPSCG